MKHRKYRMTPFAKRELALIFSFVPATVIAVVLMEAQTFADFSKQALAIGLDHFCTWSIPTFWCRVPRPVPPFAVVQVLNYLLFLAASLYLVLWISFGRYSMPAHYSPGAAPKFHQWLWALYWLWIAMGGQLILQGPIPWETVGLLFMMLALGTGVCVIRFLAVSLKFPR